MTNDELETSAGLSFPVITIHVSEDDQNEPIHVDLGSVPPFIAAAVMEKVIVILKSISPGPRITFKGQVIAEPLNTDFMSLESFLEQFYDSDDEDGEGDTGKPL